MARTTATDLFNEKCWWGGMAIKRINVYRSGRAHNIPHEEAMRIALELPAAPKTAPLGSIQGCGIKEGENEH